jgi:hypothetical protein
MPKITIHYPQEAFGDISIYSNEIPQGIIKQNSSLVFDLYKGKNTLRIKVAGSTYRDSSLTFDAVEDADFKIEGYFSKKRLLNSLLALLLLTSIMVAISYFFKLQEVILKTILIPDITLVLCFVFHALYYFHIQNKGYVFLQKQKNANSKA